MGSVLIVMVATENIINLEKERQRIVQELDRLESESAPKEAKHEGSPFGKREEEADGVMEMGKRMAVKKQLSETLAEIDHALDKYKCGTYGICDHCGKPIESGRLEALPYASLCLACKSRQQKESRGRS